MEGQCEPSPPSLPGGCDGLMCMDSWSRGSWRLRDLEDVRGPGQGPTSPSLGPLLTLPCLWPVRVGGGWDGGCQKQSGQTWKGTQACVAVPWRHPAGGNRMYISA